MLTFFFFAISPHPWSCKILNILAFLKSKTKERCINYLVQKFQHCRVKVVSGLKLSHNLVCLCLSVCPSVGWFSKITRGITSMLLSEHLIFNEPRNLLLNDGCMLIQDRAGNLTYITNLYVLVHVLKVC